MRHSIVIAAALALCACKGKTELKPDPKTQADLDQCKKNLDEKDKLIKAEEEENARLMREKGGEVVVSLEGNCSQLTVRPAKPGETHPVDDKVAAAASKEFLNVVEKSRGAIQRCYEQALKKNSGMQSHTITLNVSASFTNQGAYRDSSFSPSLGDTFDNCIKTVASKWALPTNSPAMTFKAQVSLTPS